MRPVLALAAALLLMGAPAAQAGDVDYGEVSSWLCRPGNDLACQAGLDAVAVRPDGSRAAEPFVPAAHPEIDCFYIYPTASRQTGMYADMQASPELLQVARAQAGRLASRCRLFVPIYRQITRRGLAGWMMGRQEVDWDRPYQDVLAAWRWYLTHENQGRGVVLVGHSQGTMMLRRLIAEQIDGHPEQSLLVSAFLAGSPTAAAFPGVQPCRAAADTGCVYVWGSYRDDDAARRRMFGRTPPAGQEAVCVNPAAPQGGVQALKSFLPNPAGAASGEPAWILLDGAFSAACAQDGLGNVLRVSGPPILADGAPGWGLHRWDINLVQGNILALLDAQVASWNRKR